VGLRLEEDVDEVGHHEQHRGAARDLHRLVEELVLRDLAAEGVLEDGGDGETEAA
jgi:hypothetical protein